MANYTTQANIERAIGGAAILRELLDKDGDGIADAATITDILNRADAEINSAIQIQVELPLVTVPNSVVFAATDIAVFMAYSYGSSGLALPDGLRDRYQNTLRWLDDVHNRRRTLGASTKPTADAQVVQVDRDPNSDQCTRTGMAGFA